MKRIAMLIGSVLVLGSGVVAVTLASGENVAAPPETSDGKVTASSGHEVQAAETRTVVVAPEPRLGENDGVLTVGYEQGSMPPARATDGVVTSDENCTPDAQGVSHCRNNIRMAGGETVRVQHDHRMHEVPCLVPGEKVQLRAA